MRWTSFVTVMIVKQGNMNALPTEVVKYPAMHFFMTELHKHLLGTVEVWLIQIWQWRGTRRDLYGGHSYTSGLYMALSLLVLC